MNHRRGHHGRGSMWRVMAQAVAGYRVGGSEWALAPSDEPQPRRVRLRRTRRRGSLRRLGLAVSVGCVAIMAAASLVLPPADAGAIPPMAPLPSPAPAWIDIDRPLRLFDLSAPAVTGLPLVYAARRRSQGLGRQDVMTYGAFGGRTTFLRLSISRLASGTANPADLFVDYARLAAGGGLALLRAGLPTTLPSRFGGFETADVTLSQGGTSQACLGFRLDEGASPGPIAMIGVACGTVERPITRTTLACLLDRIDLVSAGDDQPMRDFFVAAERRRTSACDAARPVRPGMTGL